MRVPDSIPGMSKKLPSPSEGQVGSTLIHWILWAILTWLNWPGHEVHFHFRVHFYGIVLNYAQGQIYITFTFETKINLGRWYYVWLSSDRTPRFRWTFLRSGSPILIILIVNSLTKNPGPQKRCYARFGTTLSYSLQLFHNGLALHHKEK
jgi:hypothetical protein